MRSRYAHVDVPTSAACLAHAESIALDVKALKAARAVGMPTTFGTGGKALAARLRAMERERAYALDVARRYETIATTRCVRTRQEDWTGARNLVDTRGHMA